MGNRLTLGRRLLRLGGLPARERHLLRRYLQAHPEGARVGLLARLEARALAWPASFSAAPRPRSWPAWLTPVLLCVAALLAALGLRAVALGVGACASWPLLRWLGEYPARARRTVLHRACLWLLTQPPEALDEELRALFRELGGQVAASERVLETCSPVVSTAPRAGLPRGRR